jgi:hypothetical protein
MAAVPKVSHISAKARAADKANLGKARAVARLLPRSARQKTASRQNLVRARATQKARRSGKGAVTARKPQAALDRPGLIPTDPGYPLDLHSLPVCAAVAMAASLRDQGGAVASAADILDLYERAGAVTLGGMCEAVTELGLAGWRLARFDPADPDLPWPGLVCGIQLGTGYHAVLRTAAGLASWGREIPPVGSPVEAWMLEWEEPGDQGAR